MFALPVLLIFVACRPTVSQKRRKKTKAASESGDVAMRDDGDAEQDAASNVEEENSLSEGPVVVRKKSKKALGKTSSSVAKRELQESPTRPTPTKKRAKLTTTVIDLADIAVKKLDLSGYEFEEESGLDTALIPRAAGVVRLILSLSKFIANGSS